MDINILGVHDFVYRGGPGMISGEFYLSGCEYIKINDLFILCCDPEGGWAMSIIGSIGYHQLMPFSFVRLCCQKFRSLSNLATFMLSSPSE
jgi:hypothetical protein